MGGERVQEGGLGGWTEWKEAVKGGEVDNTFRQVCYGLGSYWLMPAFPFFSVTMADKERQRVPIWYGKKKLSLRE